MRILFVVLFIVLMACPTLAEDKGPLVLLKEKSQKETPLDELIVCANIFLKEHSTKDADEKWIKEFEKKYREKDTYYKEKCTVTAELIKASFIIKETMEWLQTHPFDKLQEEKRENIIETCRYLTIWNKTCELMPFKFKEFLLSQISEIDFVSLKLFLRK